MNLDDLILDLSGMDDDAAYAEGRRLYEEHYVKPSLAGAIFLHDGEIVKFYSDRYDHAFRSSADRARRPYSKGKIDRDRIEYIPFIKELIQGRVLNSECWVVGDQRLYVSWDDQYILWLEQLPKGGWKFSSAYFTLPADISRYTNRSRKIWEKKSPVLPETGPEPCPEP